MGDVLSFGLDYKPNPGAFPSMPMTDAPFICPDLI
jgi:hypothetical protein